MIQRLLIANRGEIACRILRTAQNQGIVCAVVHSEADHDALHVRMADAAFCVGPAPSRDSYLDIGSILDAARDWKADAIHPGYGFLSESAAFASATEEAGFIFVGPPAQAIADMGSKARARALMQQAGVPVVPGFQVDEEVVDDAVFREQAGAIGYPVLIKAVAGGGGRGLRVVHAPAGFDAALAAVRREAAAAFGDSGILLEKYLDNARHVEVQVFADSLGNVIHLHERDCSIQRRHQKLIEEAPAPGLDDRLRNALGETAVQAAAAIHYRGAGTVEFLLQGEHFWFMEMNTRLQVEHPVTEMITGIDLVDWQLRIANGEPLPVRQDEVALQGHAIEARLNAEDPAADFLPSTGRLQQVHWPDAPGLRIDTGFMAGDRVSVHYDSLLAKLIVHARTRAEALRILASALDHTSIVGTKNNAGLLATLLRHPDFSHGAVPTTWLEQYLPELLEQTAERTPGTQTAPGSASGASPLRAWRNLVHNPYSRRYHLQEQSAPGHDSNAATAVGERSRHVVAPLPGRVITVHVSGGEQVEPGQALLVMEAMKMEHTLTASHAATVDTLLCREGELVAPDAILLTFIEENPS